MDEAAPLRISSGALPKRTAPTAAIFGAFIVAGVVTTLLGPMLPVLISRWSLTDERAGLFFTLQFTSNIAGVLSLSALIPRWGYKTTLVLGFVAIALGLAGLNAASQVGGLGATAAYGYGLGLVLPSANLWVAEAAESRRVAALSILNFMWGIGAIACAPLVLLAQEHSAISWFLYGVAGAAAAAALILSMLNLRLPQRRPETAQALNPSAGRIVAIALGALFFLYVGAENSVAGWAAALAKRMGMNLWALAPMFFWGALLAGRAFVPVNPLRKRERVLVMTGLIMGLLGSAILTVTTTFWGVVACVAMTGLGFAAIYPVLVAWLTLLFAERAPKIGSAMFILAAMGGATMPWLVGFLSTHGNNLRAGLLVPVAACAVMLVFLLWIPRRVAS